MDIYLGDSYEQLIITGPNTGGKTVTLKTIGLFSLMGQSGLHIPASDNSKLTVFNDILRISVTNRALNKVFRLFHPI